MTSGLNFPLMLVVFSIVGCLLRTDASRLVEQSAYTATADRRSLLANLHANQHYLRAAEFKPRDPDSSLGPQPVQQAKSYLKHKAGPRSSASYGHTSESTSSSQSSINLPTPPIYSSALETSNYQRETKTETLTETLYKMRPIIKGNTRNKHIIRADPLYKAGRRSQTQPPLLPPSPSKSSAPPPRLPQRISVNLTVGVTFQTRRRGHTEGVQDATHHTFNSKAETCEKLAALVLDNLVNAATMVGATFSEPLASITCKSAYFAVRGKLEIVDSFCTPLADELYDHLPQWINTALDRLPTNAVKCGTDDNQFVTTAWVYDDGDSREGCAALALAHTC